MIPRQNYQDQFKNYTPVMNGNVESEMMRQEAFIAPEMYPTHMPMFYQEMPPPPSKSPPIKYTAPMNGIYKNMQYEEQFTYPSTAQMMSQMPPMDYDFVQYGVPYPARPTQPMFRTTPNPNASAYVPQEPQSMRQFTTLKSIPIPKQNDFNSKNQAKIKNIPEFVPKQSLDNSKDGELIQVPVYQSSFNNEKDKQQFGITGLVKQQRNGENDMLYQMDLRNMGIQLNSQGLSNTLCSPFAKYQNSISGLPSFSLPSCYAQQKPTLRPGHFQKFTEETLLYIFYFFPKDQLQALAAEELYNKHWRFCETDKRWYKNNEVWDINEWKLITCEQLPSNFLSFEKVLVKKNLPQ